MMMKKKNITKALLYKNVSLPRFQNIPELLLFLQQVFFPFQERQAGQGIGV